MMINILLDRCIILSQNYHRIMKGFKDKGLELLFLIQSSFLGFAIFLGSL